MKMHKCLAEERIARATITAPYDGIVVSGGNTLNQQAIWKAQGIDLVLRQAWDRGIVLGGASAGASPFGRPTLVSYNSSGYPVPQLTPDMERAASSPGSMPGGTEL